jgi:hypothetical protein
METGLNTGPPRLLERAITPLIPAMVREEIAGDLWERFQSPARYIAEAAAILPFVIFSQARRATLAPLFALQAFTIFAAFGGFEPTLRTGHMAMWQRALTAALPALTALLLRDAYRRSNHWTLRRGAGDLAAMLFAVLAVQCALGYLAAQGSIDPYWRVTGDFLGGGLLFSLVAIFVLRSGAGLAPRTPPASAVQEMEDVARDYQVFRRSLRAKHAAEIGGLSVLLVLVSLVSLNARIPLVGKVGFVWIALALPVTIHTLLQARTRPMPSSFGRSAQLEFYRQQLLRQRGKRGLAWWFCFGPMFAGLGLNMIVRGMMNAWYGLAVGGVACMAALAVMIAQAHRAGRHQLGEKIAALDRIERLPSG